MPLYHFVSIYRLMIGILMTPASNSSTRVDDTTGSAVNEPSSDAFLYLGSFMTSTTKALEVPSTGEPRVPLKAYFKASSM